MPLDRRKQVLLDSVKKLLDLNVPPTEILDNLKSIGVNASEARQVLQEAGADVSVFSEEEQFASPDVQELSKHPIIGESASIGSQPQLAQLVQESVRKSMEVETNKLLVLVESQRALLISKIQSESESHQQQSEKLLDDRLKALETGSKKGGASTPGISPELVRSMNQKWDDAEKRFRELESTVSKIGSTPTKGVAVEEFGKLSKKLQEFNEWKENFSQRQDTTLDRLRKQITEISTAIQQTQKPGKEIDSEKLHQTILAEIQPQLDSMARKVELQLKDFIQKMPAQQKSPIVNTESIAQQVRSVVLKDVQAQLKEISQKMPQASKETQFDSAAFQKNLLREVQSMIQESIPKSTGSKPTAVDSSAIASQVKQSVMKELDPYLQKMVSTKSGASVDSTKLSQEIKQSVLLDVDTRLKSLDQKISAIQSRPNSSNSPQLPMEQIQKQLAETALKAIESGKSAWEFRVTEEFNQLEKLRVELQQRQKAMDEKIIEFVDQKQKIIKSIDDKMRELDDFEKAFSEEMGLKLEEWHEKRAQKESKKSASKPPKKGKK